MVVESPVPQEQPLAGPTESSNKPQYIEVPTSASETAPMATTSEPGLNGVDNGNDGQRSQPPHNAVNGVMPMYPFPPPPGSVYPVGTAPDMYQAIPGGPGSRMMAPVPYPFPPVQHGQPGHHGPYPFPAVMTQPATGGTSPTSPTAGQMQMPYPPYAMWYGPPGMGVHPPGSLPQNGMAPVPIPVGPYPPQPPHMYQPPPQGDVPTGENTQQQQQPNGTQQNNGVPWVPGPGGLPPKEVARTIPCRYFPECRFGASCWFLHPGVDQSQTHVNDDAQQSKPFLSGSMPPPVRYGPSGAWDPSGAAPQANGVSPVSPDSTKAPYSPQGTVPNGNYGMLYAPYPYPSVNGYPPVYPPGQQQHSASASSAPTSAPPQSPQQTSQPMSPQHGAHSVQQHPSSQTHSPVAHTPPGAPNMYPVNGHPIGYYPSPFPYPQPPPTQPPSTTPGGSATAPGLYPQTASHQLSPVNSNMSPAVPNGALDASMNPASPPMGQTGGPIPQLHMLPMPQAAHGGPIPIQAMPPGIPYPMPGPYPSVPPPHSRSPSQSMHPHSPQNPSMPPQTLYGQSPPQQPASILPPHGRHSRRESMSSMSAVPMGTLLGPNLDGNGAIDGSRSPSAFREMENGFGSNRRGRGHASRGSWSSNGFGSGRKPPCAFYPVGKCKNGDQCRFPHIMPDENSPASPASPRGGHGPFGRMANGRRPTILGPIEDKLADMTVKENDAGEPIESGPRSAGPQKPLNSSPKFRNGRTSISTPSTPGHRQTNNGPVQSQQSSQRLPSAADFPTLGGMATASSSTSGAWSGQTAAQVLKSGIAKKAATPASPVMKENKIDGDILTDDSLRVSPSASIAVEGTA